MITALWSMPATGRKFLVTDKPEDSPEYILAHLHNAGQWGVSIAGLDDRQGDSAAWLVAFGLAAKATVLGVPVLVITPAGELAVTP